MSKQLQAKARPGFAVPLGSALSGHRALPSRKSFVLEHDLFRIRHCQLAAGRMFLIRRVAVASRAQGGRAAT
jgi:hypothetical protein